MLQNSWLSVQETSSGGFTIYNVYIVIINCEIYEFWFKDTIKHG